MLAFWNRNEESPFAAFSPREVGGGAPHRAGEGHDSNNKNAIIIIIIFIVDGPLRAKSFVGRHFLSIGGIAFGVVVCFICLDR